MTPMMNTGPRAILLSDPTADHIKQIKDQDQAHTNMGHALGNFLVAAFPQAAACARSLEEAYIALMTVGSQHQIAILETQRAAMAAYRPSTANLARLVEERDQMQDQVDKAREALKTMEETMPGGYSGLMEAAMIQPILDRIKSIEEQITMVQAAMEKHEEASI